MPTTPKPVNLVIEMDDINTRGYGVLHKAGCRDVSDPMPVGTATTVAEAQHAADDATGWDYLPEGDLYRIAPCALKGLTR